MKVLELQIDDSIFTEVKTFLSILPKKKLRVKEILDDSHIAHVSSNEQEDIEKRLGIRTCHKASRSKIIET